MVATDGATQVPIVRIQVVEDTEANPLPDTAAQGIADVQVFSCNLQVHMQTVSAPDNGPDVPQ